MADETVVSNHFPALVLALGKAFAGHVEEIAKAIAADAAANHAYQNRTGEAESAFYVVTHDASTYGQGFVGGGAEPMLPEIPKAEDAQTAYVANASSHFQFLEFGTVRMPAFPSLIPAAEGQRAKFSNPSNMEDKIRKAAGI